jgi:hypothetical protein
MCLLWHISHLCKRSNIACIYSQRHYQCEDQAAIYCKSSFVIIFVHMVKPIQSILAPNGRWPAPHALYGVPARAGLSGQSHQTPNPPLGPRPRKCRRMPARPAPMIFRGPVQAVLGRFCKVVLNLKVVDIAVHRWLA